MIPLIDLARWRSGSAAGRAVITRLPAPIGHTDHPGHTTTKQHE